jgi:uncharacterized protein (DUF427 family)
VIHVKAVYEGVTIAQSDHTIVIEGNHYFPRESVRLEYLQPSAKHTTCPWKGQASYFTVTVNGHLARDAAWYYPDPKPGAAKIKDHLAFWRGVQVVADETGGPRRGVEQAPARASVQPSRRRLGSLLARLRMR